MSSYPQIVLLGDSLFQNAVPVRNGFSFQAELQSLLIRSYDVVNRGFSGYNTDLMLRFLSEVIPPPSDHTPKIKYLVLLLGANDAVIEIPGTSQHVPQDRYRENLHKILRHPHIQAHNPHIVLLTPPPVNEILFMQSDTERGYAAAIRQSKVTAQYAQIVREVAAAYPNVELMDLWRVIMDAAVARTPGFEPDTEGPWLGDPECGREGGLRDLFVDGLHFSGEGYRVFLENLLPYVIPKDMHYVFPDWKSLLPPAY